MNRCDIQQNTLVVGCEEMRSCQVVVSISDGKGGPVFCPKPRRVGFSSGNLTMSLRWQRSQPTDVCDSKAGAELLDIILMKRGFGEEEESPREIVSSNPFFCGSPPSRVSNPLVHDSQFGDEKLSPLSTLQLPSPTTPSPSSSQSPSTMKSGCSGMKFGLKPAAVRVEGFDCLSRDRQNSSITAVA